MGMKKVTQLVKSAGEKLALAGLAVASTAGTAFAQVRTDSGIINPIPIYDDDFGALINTIINITLLVAGVLAIFYLIWGGISYVTAGGDAEKASKGRVAITNAIIGIVIIAASFAIYNYIIGGLLGG
jgi:hypothetical protein